MSDRGKAIFPSTEDFFLDKARNGIVVRYVDIIFGKYFIYILTPQNVLYPCVVYNYTMQPNEYAKHNKPFIHFCNCSSLWSMYDKDSSLLKAKIPSSNLFDFQVGIGRNNSNKLFYDVELPFCPECVSVYEKVFLKFNINEKFELWNMLFSTSKVVKLEKIAIEDAINLDSKFLAMDVEIGDGLFYLTRRNNK